MMQRQRLFLFCDAVSLSTWPLISLRKRKRLHGPLCMGYCEAALNVWTSFHWPGHSFMVPLQEVWGLVNVRDLCCQEKPMELVSTQPFFARVHISSHHIFMSCFHSFMKKDHYIPRKITKNYFSQSWIQLTSMISAYSLSSSNNDDGESCMNKLSVFCNQLSTWIYTQCTGKEKEEGNHNKYSCLEKERIRYTWKSEVKSYQTDVIKSP